MNRATTHAGSPAPGHTRWRRVAAGCAACLASATAVAQAATPGPSRHAARTGTHRIVWGHCHTPDGTPPPSGEQCGTLDVPLDHSRPGGPSIRIGVSRSTATGSPAQRQGVLLFNFGGPGAAGVPLASSYAKSLPDPVRRAYDVVGFDVRGRGTSTRVDCQSVEDFAQAPKPDPALLTPRGLHAVDQAARVFADGCRRAAPALLPNLTTRQIAGDLDDLRAALGARRLNYVGYSYGTYLGAVYGQLYPRHVRRMVLDSLVDPTAVWYGTGQLQAPAFRARLDDWATWAAAHDDRYHLGTTRARVIAAWDSARARAAVRPVGGVIGGAEFDGLTVDALYSDRSWPRFTDALSAYAGPPSGSGAARNALLLALRTPPTADEENSESVFQTVSCADAPYPRDPLVFVSDARRLGRRYGYLGADIASPMACLYLHTNTEPPVHVDGADLPGILMVQGTRDPATPWVGALRLHAAMPSSRLVTVTGSGNHGQFTAGNPCVDRLASDYLVHGRLPAPHTDCPALPPPDPQHPDSPDTATRHRAVPPGTATGVG